MTTYIPIGPFVNGSVTVPVSAQNLNTMQAGIIAANGGPNFIAADANGVTTTGGDVSTALTNLLTGINTYTQIQFPSGIVNLGSANYSLDISKISFVGDRTQLNGTGTITLYSTVGYSTRQQNFGAALNGITLNGINLTIGSNTYTANAMFKCMNGGMIGGTLNYGNNAWKIHMDQFHLTGTTWSIPAGATNSGENMIWRDSFISDGSNGNIGNGDWHFIGCSIDNSTITVASASADFIGCHYENPGNGSSGFRFISVGPGGSVTIQGGIIVLNNPANAGGSTWNTAFFYVDPAVINGGLNITGLNIPLQSFYTPEVNDKVRVLVAGGGYSNVTAVTTYDSTTAAYALTASQNLLRNGGSEEGNSAGWTLTGSGSYILDTSFKNTGSSSHKIQAGSGQNATFYQDFTAVPGKKLWAQMWQSYNGAAGSSLSTAIVFFDKTGGTISTNTGYDQLTAAATRYKPILAVIPAGAVTGRIQYYLTGGSSATSTMNVDDVIINVA